MTFCGRWVLHARQVLACVAVVLAVGALCVPAAARAEGKVFRDCEECPVMVVVPAGTFEMGSPRRRVSG